jgi:hypothetical protein
MVELAVLGGFEEDRELRRLVVDVAVAAGGGRRPQGAAGGSRVQA